MSIGQGEWWFLRTRSVENIEYLCPALLLAVARIVFVAFRITAVFPIIVIIVATVFRRRAILLLRCNMRPVAAFLFRAGEGQELLELATIKPDAPAFGADIYLDTVPGMGLHGTIAARADKQGQFSVLQGGLGPFDRKLGRQRPAARPPPIFGSSSPGICPVIE